MIPKVQCRECFATTPDHRCLVRYSKKALAPGRKRRCSSFFARFSKHAKTVNTIGTRFIEPVISTHSTLQTKTLKKKGGGISNALEFSQINI